MVDWCNTNCALYNTGNHDEEKCDSGEKLEDKKLEAAFKTWKSKTYALTVPLKVIALRGSVPPAWAKVCGILCCVCFVMSC